MTPVKLDIQHLEKVAREADGGDNWQVVPYGYGDSLVIHEGEDWRVCFMSTPGDSPGAMDRIEARAEHIATFDPPTVRALLGDRKAMLEALAVIARLRTDLSGDFSMASHQSDIARAAIARVEAGERNAPAAWGASGGIRGPDGYTHYDMEPTDDGEDAIVTWTSPARRMFRSEFLHHFAKPYDIRRPDGGWRDWRSFNDAEKKRLRPIAETLAMLDGNAFFGGDIEDGHDWYEQYLPEADALYQANGGDSGWSGQADLSDVCGVSVQQTPPEMNQKGAG